jgi:uncharacterized YkwD family protein
MKKIITAGLLTLTMTSSVFAGVNYTQSNNKFINQWYNMVQTWNNKETTQVSTVIVNTTKCTTQATTQKPTQTTTKVTTEATTETTTQKPTQTTTQVTTQKPTQTTTQKPTQTTTVYETTTQATTQSASGSTGSTTQSGYAKQVLDLVNAERAKQGLSALTLNTNVNEVAQLKAEDMKKNNYFSHTSPTYGTPFQMLKTYGITYKTAGENIAKGQTTPQQVVNDWMNSEGHRKNILSSSYTQMGLGYSGGYWAQIFIG